MGAVKVRPKGKSKSSRKRHCKNVMEVQEEDSSSDRESAKFAILGKLSASFGRELNLLRRVPNWTGTEFDALSDTGSFCAAAISDGLEAHTSESETSACTDDEDASIDSSTDGHDSSDTRKSDFTTLRLSYLLITLVIMLADGLQGTHLYVLYESYGASVASLYCLGFVTGGILSPVTGPLIDKMGRKRAAMLYCILEIFINQLEQYPYLWGLIASRMIGGFTTNLLSTVFEAWLDTEYRRRGLCKEKYEIIMRDSVIVSNLAAIGSGFLADYLAHYHDAVGPFRGAVTCTAIALAVVVAVWSENYGNANDQITVSMTEYLTEAYTAVRSDSRMLRVGVLQGLTAGSIQTFIFLWAPTLKKMARSAPFGTWGLDHDGEPAYGIIFGAFMSAGVLGGMIAPYLRRGLSILLSPLSIGPLSASSQLVGERPMAVEFLSALCYLISAALLLLPSMAEDSPRSFSRVLGAYLLFETLIGVFLPCEGVIRSLYYPASARASVMVLPRTIVNIVVSAGVISTNWVSLETASAVVSTLLLVSAFLQLSLISLREWSSLVGRAKGVAQYVRSVADTSVQVSASALRQLSNSLQKGLGGCKEKHK